MRVTDLSSELRHAARTLKRTPGFAMLAIGTLGLALGALAALFSVVDTVLLRPFPYAQPERLVVILATAPGSQMPEEFGVANEFYVQYRERSKLLEDVAITNSFTNSLRYGDRVERLPMSAPTETVFSTLGVAPALGRLPTAADEDRAIVISDRLWNDWFGRDPAVLGKLVRVFGEERPIVGVMPASFRFPEDRTLLWVSNPVTAADIEQPGQFGNALVGRLKPGATIEALNAELTAIARELPVRFGGTPAYARLIEQHRAIVRTLDEQLLGDFRRPLWVLLAATALVLLIACANLANLFLVRAESR
ncbi:MAG TPA: ABC transporter permease, partial [Candidatus Saccharimonadia bacterium]|nr:ABC transporter permease [Candidatus Saccharimonadia bacterium]